MAVGRSNNTGGDVVQGQWNPPFDGSISGALHVGCDVTVRDDELLPVA